MKQAGELELLLSQTVAATDKPDFYSNIPYSDPLKIKFNRHYFVTLKLLVSELTQHYQKEKGAFFVNHKLLKFIEFGQKFLNYFCVQATFHPENLNQYSFELSLFYIVYTNLARKFKFSELIAALLNLHISIIHECKTSSLINTDIKDFHIRFRWEITGFENYLHALYDVYLNDKCKEDLIIDDQKFQQFIVDIMESNLHLLQRQFCITLMQFAYLIPLLMTDQAFYKIDNLLSSGQNIQELYGKVDIKVIADKLFGHNPNRSQERFLQVRDEYDDHLCHHLAEQLPNIDKLIVLPIKVISQKDLRDLNLNFIILTHLDFSKVKLPIEMSGCVFINCFLPEDKLNNTQFRKCIFYNCNFSWFTIHGAFKSCKFIDCNFKSASFEWLDLGRCTFKQCSLENTDWYKVDAVGTYIENTSFVNASIKFSNIDQARLIRVDLTNALFEGTNVKLASATQCNWTNTNLASALFLNGIHVHFKEYLWVNVNVVLTELFQNPQRYQNVFISSENIITKLNQLIDDETPINQINYKARFRQLLGWISCAIDRLSSYYDFYEKNKNTFIFASSLNVMESLAEITKLAINLLNNRYLTLYDRCHLSSMTQNMINNSLFSYQQYQDIMNKKWANKKIYLGPYFTNTEKSICPNNDIENDDTESKFFKRESLLAIQQLPSTLKRINEVLAEMRNHLQNNQRLTADNPRPGR